MCKLKWFHFPPLFYQIQLFTIMMTVLTLGDSYFSSALSQLIFCHSHCPLTDLQVFVRSFSLSLIASCALTVQLQPQEISPPPTANLDRSNDKVYENVTGLVKAVIEMSSKIQPAPPEEYVPMVKVTEALSAASKFISVSQGPLDFHFFPLELQSLTLKLKTKDRDVLMYSLMSSSLHHRVTLF